MPFLRAPQTDVPHPRNGVRPPLTLRGDCLFTDRLEFDGQWGRARCIQSWSGPKSEGRID